jgi:hypothetical protein
MKELIEWDSFYIIVGTAAGALIGLQFVVMMLIAEKPPKRAAEAGAAFATPTIVHFSVTLFLAAMLRAPWHNKIPIIFLLGLIGLSGVIYMGIVGQHMRVQTAYRPEFVDWLFRILLPLAAYLLLGISSFVMACYFQETLFGIGAASLLLLFIGIHNAWDNVVYHVLVNRGSSQDKINNKNDRL